MPEQAGDPGRNKEKKEAKQPQDLLGAHHQKGHGDRGFRALGQPSHDQFEGILALP